MEQQEDEEQGESHPQVASVAPCQWPLPLHGSSSHKGDKLGSKHTSHLAWLLGAPKADEPTRYGARRREVNTRSANPLRMLNNTSVSLTFLALG